MAKLTWDEAGKHLYETGVDHVVLYRPNESGVYTGGVAWNGVTAINESPSGADSNPIYADNIKYWSGYTGGTFEGDLEVAIFDDEFKTQFLGYRELTSGGLATVKNATKPNVYVAFEFEGDKEHRKAIFYNCALGGINREYNTIEESKEPVTETLSVTVIGDNGTGVTKAVFAPTDTGYATLFTAPTAPVFAP